MLTFLFVASMQHQDRVVLGAPHGQVSSAFYDKLLDAPKPHKSLYLNGRRTSYTVPKEAELHIYGRNRDGRVIGWLGYLQATAGARLWTEYYGINFTTERGKVEELPFSPDVIDDKGRVFGQTMDEGDMGADEPYMQPKLWLWIHGKTSGLGYAYAWRLLKDGTIEGYYVTDRAGNSIEPYVAYMEDYARDDMRFRWFWWRNGKRTEAKGLVDKLPFPAHSSQQWWNDNVQTNKSP